MSNSRRIIFAVGAVFIALGMSGCTQAGPPELAEAIAGGDLGGVEGLLAEDPDLANSRFPLKLNWQDKEGGAYEVTFSEEATALYAAAWHNDAEMVKLLLERGAEVDGKIEKSDSIGGDFGRNPFLLAVKGGKEEILRQLIESGANVNATDASGQAAIHYYLFDKEIVELLIAAGADVNTRDNQGNSLLHILACGSEVEANEKNLALPAEDRLQIVKLLIDAGADAGAKDAQGDTPLHLVAESKYFSGQGSRMKNIDIGQKQFAELLIAGGADVNARDSQGNTALHRMSFGMLGCEVMYAMLYAESPISSRGLEECEIIRLRCKETADLLIENAADLNAQNNIGNTPLHSYLSNQEIAMQLIFAGADLDIKNNEGDTPLHTYTFHAGDEVALVLVIKGADVNAKNQLGQTPLHFVSDMQVTEFLIKNGADVNAKDNQGKTALHNAASLAVSTRIGSRGFDSETALRKAMFLIAAGADANAEDNSGTTPLAAAEAKGFTEMVELLQKFGTIE